MHTFLNLSASLLPVVVFLLALVALDSFKLVHARALVAAIALGCLMALASLLVNNWLADRIDFDPENFAKYVAPVVEEILKATFVVYLIRGRRVGFMVDAAIFGFAVGAGFAIVENIYIFTHRGDQNPLLWLIRGFGTAVMHGGVTAIVGIISKRLSDRYPSGGALVFVPGLVLAILIHSVYNHFFFSPVLSTIGILVALPILTVIVFQTSERATRRWLGVRFDTDAELLEMINAGRTSESRVGAYLESLQSRFPGDVVADMLCMLRLHLELSIRAKGILLMREAGFPVQPEPEVEARFEELEYLEKSIGRTGRIAISPILNMSNHELWQLYMVRRG